MTGALAALKEAQKRLHGAGMLGGLDDPVNAAISDFASERTLALEAAYTRGAAWACALGGAASYQEVRKAARDYADRMTSSGQHLADANSKKGQTP